MRLILWVSAIALTAGAASAEEPAITPTPATATAPATQSLSDKLFGDLPEHSDTAPGVVTTAPATLPSTTSPGVSETASAVGPTEPKVKSLEEGTIVARRVVRLSVNKQTGEYLAVFEGDGKLMHDPPMVVVPSSSLQDMEKISENGKRPVRFQITGEVTEYRGRNYILIKEAVALKELNSGISGG